MKKPALITPHNASPRYLLIDVLRGGSIVLMIAYHSCFDLNYHGWIHQDFNTAPFWLAARAGIVSSFLLLAGISLTLNAQRTDSTSFWRRQARLLAACVAVSAGSYLMFPQSLIFFGILHFILLASLTGRLFVNFGSINLALGLLLATTRLSHPLFNSPPLQWLGFMTYKPYTEDYVPFFPWFGVVLLGIYLGGLIVRQPERISGYRPGPAMQKLALAGQHSLVIYLLHQPVLLAGFTLVTLF